MPSPRHCIRIGDRQFLPSEVSNPHTAALGLECYDVREGGDNHNKAPRLKTRALSMENGVTLNEKSR